VGSRFDDFVIWDHFRGCQLFFWYFVWKRVLRLFLFIVRVRRRRRLFLKATALYYFLWTIFLFWTHYHRLIEVCSLTMHCVNSRGYHTSLLLITLKKSFYSKPFDFKALVRKTATCNVTEVDSFLEKVRRLKFNSKPIPMRGHRPDLVSTWGCWHSNTRILLE